MINEKQSRAGNAGQASLPLLYGHWSTAIACMATQGLGMGVFGIYGLFVLPLHRELGIDVASLNLGLALMMVLMGVMGPALGPILDKTSIKRIMMLGAVWAMLGFCLLSTAFNALTLILYYSFTVIGLGLYGPMTGNTLLVKSYTADRARALAIAALGVSIASMLLPPLVAYLLELYDWHVAMVVVGLISGICVFSALWLAVPDVPPHAGQTEEHEAPIDTSTAFLRRASFWIIGLVFAIIFSAAVLTTTSYIPHLQTLGYSVMDASLLLASGGAAGMVGKLSYIWIANHIRHKVVHLLLFILAMQIAGWLIFINNTEPLPLYAAQALLGFSAGISIPLQPLMISLYFDARIIGKINGFQAPLFLPFGFLLPYLGGRAYDLTGNYMQGFQVATALLVLSVVPVLFLYRIPQKA